MLGEERERALYCSVIYKYIFLVLTKLSVIVIPKRILNYIYNNSRSVSGNEFERYIRLD